MNWRRLTLSVNAADVEAASALLSTASGAYVSVYEGALDHRSPKDGAVDVRSPKDGAVDVRSPKDGAVDVRSPKDGAVDVYRRPPRSVVSVYVPEKRAAGAVRRVAASLASARRQGLLRSARRSGAKVRDEDWATGWKRFYKPSKLADGLYVVPSWRKDFRPPRGARTIQLDPGMAFGTGQHATTRTALRLLLDHVHAGKAMLDIGCGSGVLGLAAAQRGAKVYACDIDPIATAATRENFRANGLRAAAVKRASGVPAGFPRAPLIVANITAETLAPLARAFAAKLKSGGALVTSGVTTRGRAGVLKAFSAAGLRMIEERRSGEWLSHVHVRAKDA